MMDEGFEAVGIQIGEFPASFEAVLVLWVADQVEVHVFDDGHVSWAVCGAEARKVVVEDDVEHPMETPQWARTAAAKVLASSLAEER